MQIIKNFLSLAILACGIAAQAQVDLINKVKSNQSENAKAGFQFETIIDLEANPVKNQGASGTCWSYCSNSFIESEMARMEKEPVDIAEMFTVRKVYEEKAEKYVRMHGQYNFGQGGALPDALQMLQKYGTLPASLYEGLNYGTSINRHGEMEAILKGMLDAVIANKNKQLSPAWKEAYNKVLDVYLGAIPEEFEYMGKTFTPKSFADTYVGIDANDYVQVSSFSHQPYYEPFVMMVPDNWAYGQTYNVHMEDMINIIDHALAEGYSISWATDVSEKYFSWKNGIAFVPTKPFKQMSAEEKATLFAGPQPEMDITPEIRQAAYDNYTTTDDHGMQIVGKAKDQDGKEWYIVKNSWGTKNDYEGYLYVSKNYVRYKTIALLLHKNAIPAGIKGKLDL